MRKTIEPMVQLTCHFCGEYLKFEVIIDTTKIWQARVHPCRGGCTKGLYDAAGV